MAKIKTVVFIGTDGAGKTTLISEIRAAIGEAKCSDLYLGEKKWRFHFSKLVFDLRHKSVFNRIFQYIIYPVDLWARKQSVKKSSLHHYCLVDRLPGFPFVHGKNLKFYLYSLVLPDIDLIVLVEGDAEKIWKRKREKLLEGTIKDIQKWQNVAEALVGSSLADQLVKLDSTEKTISESVDHIIDIMNIDVS